MNAVSRCRLIIAIISAALEIRSSRVIATVFRSENKSYRVWARALVFASACANVNPFADRKFTLCIPSNARVSLIIIKRVRSTETDAHADLIFHVSTDFPFVRRENCRELRLADIRNDGRSAGNASSAEFIARRANDVFMSRHLHIRLAICASVNQP